MRTRLAMLMLAAGLATAALVAAPAHADNQMGYRLLSNDEAAQLPHNRGTLGMDIEAAQRITDAGLTFDLMRVTQVRRGSAGERAGFHRGDEIIAVDGRVFASLRAFAGYVGSLQPGSQMNVDAIPAGGGPAQAERITAVVGGANGAAPQASAPPGGMSTRAKIGLGMAALFGCYELGCFSHGTNQSQANPRR